MPIKIHGNGREFHLYNHKISYIMTILRNGQLGHLYYGKAVRDQASFEHMLEIRIRSMAPCFYEGDREFSMEHIKQEYPSYGHGDMRCPAYDILQADGSRITEFVYESHCVREGKPALKGLPATYAEQARVFGGRAGVLDSAGRIKNQRIGYRYGIRFTDLGV